MRRTIRLRESELRRMISESVRRVLTETDYTLRNSLPRDLNGELLRVGDKVVYYNRTGNYDEIPYRVGGTISEIKSLDNDEGDGFLVTILIKKGKPVRTFKFSTIWSSHDIEKDNGTGVYNGFHDDLTKKVTKVLYPNT